MKTDKAKKASGTETLETMMDRLPGNIYWKNKKGEYLECNSNAFKTFRLNSKKEILGKTDYDLMSKSMADAVHQIDLHIMKTQKAQIINEIDSQHDKPVHYLSYKAPIHDEKGIVVGIMGVSFDVTDIRKDEANKRKILEEIIERVPANIYWKDKKGKYLGCNKNMLKKANLKLKEEMVGRTDYELLGKSSSHATKIHKADLKIMNLNQPALIEEVVKINEDPTYYLSYKAPLHDTEGNVTGIAGISFDITERKAMEKRIQDLLIREKELEARVQTMKGVAFSIAHELKTPLAMIYGACMDKRPLETVCRAYLATKKKGAANDDSLSADAVNKLSSTFSSVEQIASRAGHFVNMLLAYIRSQTNAGKEESLDPRHFKKLSIQALIRSTLKNYPYRTTDDPKAVHVENAVDFTFMGTEMLVEHVLFNLLRNALHFILTKEGAEISIRCEKGKTANRLIFKDTGPGIKPDILPHIFDDFFSTRQHGCGIGLSYSRWIMHRLGGEIECQSVLGRYTEFTLTFPIG